MVHPVAYSDLAVRQLKKLDRPMQHQILKRIEKLAEHPELAKPLSNVFKNFFSERIGKYRIVFSIKENTLIIAKIEHRETVYK